MVYTPELIGLRREVRRSTVTTLTYWPKLEPTGNITASATASDNTYEVFDYGGVSIQASGNITVVAVTGVGSRFDLSIPSIATLAEDNFVRMRYRETGVATVYQQTIYFDVVTEPWGPSQVSLNSLQDLVPTIGDRINRQALSVGRTQEQHASQLAYQARVQLDEWLRGKISEDAAAAGANINVRGPSLADRYTRPRLILNKERLHTIEVRLALACAFRGDMQRDVDSEEQGANLFEYWRQEAETSFRGLGPLKYDWTDDQIVDVVKEDLGRVQHMRRVQA